MGEYGGYEHAVFFASDYWDECLLVNLDDDTEVISMDIAYGFSDVKKPAFDTYSEI
jgi:hypothetical protein